MVDVAFDGSHQRLGLRSVLISQAHEAYLLLYPESVTWRPDASAAYRSVFEFHAYVLMVRVGREVFLKSRKLIDQRGKWSPREFCNFIFHMKN